MEKKYLEDLLERSKEWESGETEDFAFDSWNLTLRKEETRYSPYIFAITGRKNDSRETWGRRYLSSEQALLHVLNHFNENTAVRNRYTTIEEFLQS